MDGRKLASWRKQHGLTQRQLAVGLGVDVMTISRWERGVRRIPTYIPLTLEALESHLKKEKHHGPVS
jgi:transcriptional regulator with XRE-family HTH domain